MKKIGVLIVTASAVIAACMIYLVKSGISLAPQVLIKPSHFAGTDEIASAVAIRMFPYFDENKYGWVFFDRPTETSRKLEELSKLIFMKSPKKLHNGKVLSGGTVSVDEELPSAITTGFLYIQSYKRGEFSLGEECADMKRLNYRCFVEVSLHKSRRKMKEDGRKYFLLTSYLDKHFLLLVEE